MATDISAEMSFVANRFEYGCIFAAPTFLIFSDSKQGLSATSKLDSSSLGGFMHILVDYMLFMPLHWGLLIWFSPVKPVAAMSTAIDGKV